jgi:chitin synthase
MVYQVFNLIFAWFALVSFRVSLVCMCSVFSQANYYIAFKILSGALEDNTFKLNGIHIVNIILDYFYLGLLIMCFILSLGNRPQGSKWGYTLAIIGFGFITIYMTVRLFVYNFRWR